MKWKCKEYTIIDSKEHFFIRIDTYILGFWLISEVLCNPMLGSPRVFYSYPEAKEMVGELRGKKKSINRKLKLLRNERGSI